MAPTHVTLATPDDRERVIATVVAAFERDPALRFFFPDDATYPALAATLAGWLFDKRVRHDTVWVIEGGASVAMWDAPVGKHDAGTPLELELPTDVLERLALYDAAGHALLPSSPYWYLGVLATHPEHAGQRWGRALMAEGLRHASTDGLPAYLETTTQANVGIYQRAGWDIADSVDVKSITVHVMCYSPRAPNAS